MTDQCAPRMSSNEAVPLRCSSTTKSCAGGSIPKWGVRAVVRGAEQRGFPKINPLWRGRYWPAVQEWLDSDNGVGKHDFLSHAEDGPENFNAPAR